MRLDRTLLRNAGRWLLHRSAPLLALFLLLLVYFLGVRTERSGFVQQVLDPGLKRITRPVLNAFRGGAPKVEEIQLVFSDSAWQRLEHWGIGPLPVDTPDSAPSTSVEALLIRGKDTLRVDCTPALTGPAPLHAAAPTCILRSPGPDLPGGMSRALIAPPGESSALHQWLFAKALERAGLPFFPVALTELRVNGRDKGLYVWRSLDPAIDSAMTAHPWGDFDPHLMQRASLLPSPHRTAPLPQEQLIVASLRYQGGQAEGPAARAWSRAMRTLRSSADGENLDAERCGALLALCDLFGVQGELRWTEVKLLLDISTGKLVPFPPGERAGVAIGTLAVHAPEVRSDELFGPLLADGSVREAYHGWLEQLTVGGWSDSLFSEVNEVAMEFRSLMRIEPSLAPFDTTIIAHDRRVIERTLAPPDPARAFLRPGGDRVRVASLHPLPLRMVALVSGEDTLPILQDLRLAPYDRATLLDYVEIPISPSGGVPDRLLMKVPGTKRMLSVGIERSGSLDAVSGM
ncbi:MAG: hypothetical protein R2817_03995 [Flavobacteriales bacterium]